MTEEKKIIDFSKAGANAALLSIDKIPGIDLFCSVIEFPGISTEPIEVFTPQFVTGHAHSIKMKLNDLSVTFIVSETFNEYFAVWKWVRDNCFKDPIAETITNAKLTLFDNHKQPMKNFSFWDLQPISISNLTFNVNSADPLTAVLGFRCESYEFHDILRN
jgi:hypothetical protein